MNYKTLLEKYKSLLDEVSRLTKENDQLKAHFALTESALSRSPASTTETEKPLLDNKSTESHCISSVDSTSDSISKIRLFMSLFRGR